MSSFECSICFELYNSTTNVPTSFPCGHSSCLKHTADMAYCHICRAELGDRLTVSITIRDGVSEYAEMLSRMQEMALAMEDMAAAAAAAAAAATAATPQPALEPPFFSGPTESYDADDEESIQHRLIRWLWATVAVTLAYFDTRADRRTGSRADNGPENWDVRVIATTAAGMVAVVLLGTGPWVLAVVATEVLYVILLGATETAYPRAALESVVKRREEQKKKHWLKIRRYRGSTAVRRTTAAMFDPSVYFPVDSMESKVPITVKGAGGHSMAAAILAFSGTRIPSAGMFAPWKDCICRPMAVLPWLGRTHVNSKEADDTNLLLDSALGNYVFCAEIVGIISGTGESALFCLRDQLGRKSFAHTTSTTFKPNSTYCVPNAAIYAGRICTIDGKNLPIELISTANHVVIDLPLREVISLCHLTQRRRRHCWNCHRTGHGPWMWVACKVCDAASYCSKQCQVVHRVVHNRQCQGNLLS